MANEDQEQNQKYEDMVKFKIGYTETVARCDKCLHSEEKEHVMGGTFYWVCTYSNLGSIPIQPQAHCRFFVLTKLQGEVNE